MDAASAASAHPSVSTRTKCSGFPAPPLAITGTCVARDTAAVSAQSNPPCTPSVSMEVGRTSPAPSCSPRAAQATASIPSSSRPPRVNTCQPPPEWRRASIARTTACAPNSPESSVISSGLRTAAVLTETLSAPASKIIRASSTERMPPPTASGMNTFRAVRATTSAMIARASLDAVMSRKTSSSAPSRLYRSASSTGSPASRRLTNLVPFTTLPPVTSRHGIIRFANIDTTVSSILSSQRLRVSAVKLKTHKVAHHPQPHFTRFLRMKLYPKNIPPLDRRRISHFIPASRRRVLHFRHIVTMREVDIRTRACARQQPRSSARLQPVPSHVWNPRLGRKPHHAAREHPQAALLRRLFASLEQRLHTQADSQERYAPEDPFPQRLPHFQRV